MKKTSEMICGDWQPTQDPTGRQVRFTTWQDEEMWGTVVAVEYEEDREPTLYVNVTSPDEHRGELAASYSRITWLDADQHPWAVSKSPAGRWVCFKDVNHVEHFGCVFSVDSRHSQDALLSVMVIELGDILQVDWRRVEWLPM